MGGLLALCRMYSQSRAQSTAEQSTSHHAVQCPRCFRLQRTDSGSATNNFGAHTGVRSRTKDVSHYTVGVPFSAHWGMCGRILRAIIWEISLFCLHVTLFSRPFIETPDDDQLLVESCSV